MIKFLRAVIIFTFALVAIQPVEAQQAYNGVVSEAVGGLRLRFIPSETGVVVAILAPNTPVRIIRRTNDNAWLEVMTGNNERGWVARAWIKTDISLTTLPIVSSLQIPSAIPTATPRPAPPPVAPAITNISASPAKEYAVVSGVSQNARQIFLRGQQLGNRADVFSKVGDSITSGTYPPDSPFLVPIGNGKYNLDQYGNLQSVIDYFSRTKARDANSFANTSLAARAGWASWMAMTIPKYPTAPCHKDETPLACEYRIVKPAAAIIMFGTNDVRLSSLATYEKYMRLIIETSIQNGIVPIVSTIPAIKAEWGVNRAEQYNAVVIKLAREYDVPLLDYYAAMKTLPYDGLAADGVHPSLPPTLQTAFFTQKNVGYGYTLRNLTALQALDTVWREVLTP
jgi:lysophospholipase L1-like esterase